MPDHDHAPAVVTAREAGAAAPAPGAPGGHSVLGGAIRYLIVGGLSAGLDIGLLVGLRELAGLPIPVATTIAFWVALAGNFWLNKAWSFPNPQPGGRPFLRYMVLVGVNYLATVAIVTGGAAAGLPYVVAKVLAIGAAASWTFVAYRRWVFA